MSMSWKKWFNKQAKNYDVIVVGAGNAALCAALSAKENGANVLVIEKAPYDLRGGNTYYTDAALRFPYEKEDIEQLVEIDPKIFEIKPFTKDEFYKEFMEVSHGEANPVLVKVLSDKALSTIKWVHSKVVEFIPTRKFASRKGDKLLLYTVPIEAKDEGKGLSRSLFRIAEKEGIDFIYKSELESLFFVGNKISGVNVKTNGALKQFRAKAIILGCGGFESDPNMRKKNLGEEWEQVKVRGTSFNTGQGLKAALEVGAKSVGHWSGCHAIHWDKNAPDYGDRELTILLSRRKHHLGITVNSMGARFIDEGEDFPLLTYAKIGQTLLKQPDGVGFQIFDSKIYPLLPEEYHKGSWVVANTLDELADKLKIDSNNFSKTVTEFNNAVQNGQFDMTILDGKSTKEVTPPKSNWALAIDTPPYYAFPIVCGITFTFGGIAINDNAQVLDKNNKPIMGLFACGEMVGLFHYNYPGGAGLVAGEVFVKIAGENAAK